MGTIYLLLMESKKAALNQGRVKSDAVILQGFSSRVVDSMKLVAVDIDDVPGFHFDIVEITFHYRIGLNKIQYFYLLMPMAVANRTLDRIANPPNDDGEIGIR